MLSIFSLSMFNIGQKLWFPSFSSYVSHIPGQFNWLPGSHKWAYSLVVWWSFNTSGPVFDTVDDLFPRFDSQPTNQTCVWEQLCEKPPVLSNNFSYFQVGLLKSCSASLGASFNCCLCVSSHRFHLIRSSAMSNLTQARHHLKHYEKRLMTWALLHLSARWRIKLTHQQQWHASLSRGWLATHASRILSRTWETNLVSRKSRFVLSFFLKIFSFISSYHLNKQIRLRHVASTFCSSCVGICQFIFFHPPISPWKKLTHLAFRFI